MDTTPPLQNPLLTPQMIAAATQPAQQPAVLSAAPITIPAPNAQPSIPAIGQHGGPAVQRTIAPQNAPKPPDISAPLSNVSAPQNATPSTLTGIPQVQKAGRGTLIGDQAELQRR